LLKPLFKPLLDNLLGILFLVGAASGFFVTLVGWTGLNTAQVDINRLYHGGTGRLQMLHDLERELFGLQAQMPQVLSSRSAIEAELDAANAALATFRQRITELASAQGESHREDWLEASRLLEVYSTQAQRAAILAKSDTARALAHYNTVASPYLQRVQQVITTLETDAISTARELHSNSMVDTSRMRLMLQVVAIAASLFFCMTAWVTYTDERDRREKAQELTRERTRFRSLFESTSDALILLNRGGFLDYNKAAGDLFQIPDLTILRNRRLGDFQPRHQPDGHYSEVDFLARINNCMNFGTQQFEWTFRSLQGREFPADVAATLVRLDNDDIIQLSIRDITARKEAENALQLAARVFENAIEGVVVTDDKSNILLVNKAFTHITGYPPEEAIGQNPRLLKSNRHDEQFYKDLWHTLQTTGQWQGEIWNRRKTGEIYPEWLNISRVWDVNAKVTNYVGIFSDISERKSAEEKILHQIYFDRLTDLPNRVLFVDRINQAIAQAQRDQKNVLALMHLDLDRFKIINDTFGHEAGDQLIKMVAAKLRDCVRDTDTVARMTGDEFGVLLSPIHHAEDALFVANKIMKTFDLPFTVQGNEVYLSLSIGISVYPADGKNSEMLLKNGDMARYRAKSEGGKGCYLYDDNLRVWANDRLKLETDLRRAVGRNELVLYYQPQCDFQTGKLNGFESLVRWKHPELGLLGPDRFIPLAEETGLILELGAWVLRQACIQAQSWRDTGFEDVLVAVNFSSAQLLQPDIVEQVSSVLKETGLPPHCLEIEITESVMMRDVESCIDVMHTLAGWGVQFAIDDFGTGYSSLAYLKKLPIHALKIDKAFLRDIHTDQDNAAIVSAIIAMAQKLGIKVVAEGIESMEQVDYFTGSGEERDWQGNLLPVEVRGQGYLFGKPQPPESLLELVQRQNLLEVDGSAAFQQNSTTT
jgi:diguanylate cyclase (GGDEF)-like protein/PAS domain S-box-containing protein